MNGYARELKHSFKREVFRWQFLNDLTLTGIEFQSQIDDPIFTNINYS